MTESLQKLIAEYLQYFRWFLEGEIASEELDYMLHLRDRIQEARGDLGDLDTIWRANAKRMLERKSVFQKPMSDSWWWNESTWRKLASRATQKKPRKIRSVGRLPA